MQTIKFEEETGLLIMTVGHPLMEAAKFFFDTLESVEKDMVYLDAREMSYPQDNSGYESLQPAYEVLAVIIGQECV